MSTTTPLADRIRRIRHAFPGTGDNRADDVVILADAVAALEAENAELKRARKWSDDHVRSELQARLAEAERLLRACYDNEINVPGEVAEFLARYPEPITRGKP